MFRASFACVVLGLLGGCDETMPADGKAAADDSEASGDGGARDSADPDGSDPDGADGGDCDPLTFYRDADDDGYGDADDVVEDCVAPDGYVADASDCDDTNGGANPGAAEICDPDDVDEDCDGLRDDGDDSVDPTTFIGWHTDGDGDGAAGVDATWACDSPAGEWSEAGDDCDDADPSVGPGEDELCEDGIDNNCDGHIDEGCLPDSLDDAVAQISGDGDGFGHRVAGGDVTGDGIDDLIVGAYIAGSTYAGQAYVFAGPVSGVLTAADAVGVVAGTVSEGALGYSVAVVDDADGDGVHDLLLGAPGLGGSSASSNGTAYLVAASPVGALSVPADAFAWFVGARLGANGGSAADDMGDVNGDGVVDFIVGAQQAWDLGGSTGQTYLLYGPVSGAYDLGTEADAVLWGTDWAGGMADWLSSGDLTGDGLDDIIVPANTSVGAGFVAGAVFVVSDPSPGQVSLEDDADAWVSGVAYSGFGQVTALGDWTGDGYLDLVASDGTVPGTVYVIEGPLSGETDVLTAHATVVGLGTSFMDRTGMALDRTDLDHDGSDDLAIGAPHVDTTTTGAGAVHVFLGPLVGGAHSVGAADVTFDGTSPDSLGIAVASVGDTTGDGQEELAITSTYRNEGAGMVWLLE